MSKIEWKPVKVKLSDLDHWKDNPVTLSEAQAKKLLKSEKTLGKAQAFSVSPKKKSGKRDLYDGHQRCNVWGAAYGMDTVVNAVESSRFLTDKERRRMAVMTRTATGSLDTSIISGWDSEELFDFGYDADLLKDMKNTFGGLSNFIESEEPEPVDAEPQINRAAELQKVWNTKLGQLWQIGEHRLLVGDCTVRENVERLMVGEKMDLLFTSPPYNQGNSKGDLSSHRKEAQKLYEEYNDKLSNEEYKELLFCFLETAKEFLSELHAVVVNISYNSNARDLYGKVLFSDRNPYSVKETIVWDKKNALNFPNAGIYSRRCEFVFVMSACDIYLTSQTTGNTRWNYWEISKESQSREHRAAFPLPLAERAISEFSLCGHIVYEPFCGTGTAIIAAQNLNRRCFAMEISPAYAAVCLQRMADAFGITGVLIDEKE